MTRRNRHREAQKAAGKSDAQKPAQNTSENAGQSRTAGSSGSSYGMGVGVQPAAPKRTEPYQGLPFAPYNFVPFSSNVMPYKGDIPAHNGNLGEFCSGEIEYVVTATKKICVGGIETGVEENAVTAFYRNSDNAYAIPGSTMRGLVRSNAQILSHSYIGDDVENSRFLYRDVAGDRYSMKKEYSHILGIKANTDGDERLSVPRNVRCGYITRKDGKYVVYGTQNDDFDPEKTHTNYFVTSEKFITESEDGFDYLFSGSFKPQFQYENGEVRDDAVKLGNRKYGPFREPISYSVNDNQRIRSIGAPEPDENDDSPYLVRTGFMEGKKALYVIPKIDRNNVIMNPIPSEDIRTYQADLNRKESILRSEKNGNIYDYYTLPEEGEVRPIFYILADGRFYFGYTPRLRIFYNHTVRDGLPQKRADMDYAKALFGYIRLEDEGSGSDSPEFRESRKTRVSFTDALIEGSSRKIELQHSYILSSPKPTSYLDYIEQTSEDGITSYNGYLDCSEGSKQQEGDGRFTLRGVKQYWIKSKEDEPTVAEGETVTRFKSLPNGTQFRGYIRFHNLRREELGLLIESIEPGDDNLQNIGRAKSYGFGAVRIRIHSIRLFDPKKAYNREKFCLNPMVEISDEEKIELVERFEEIVKDEENESSGFKEQREAFRIMKSKTIVSEDVEYMSIDAGDYKKRKDEHQALPSAVEVWENSQNRNRNSSGN